VGAAGHERVRSPGDLLSSPIAGWKVRAALNGQSTSTTD